MTETLTPSTIETAARPTPMKRITVRLGDYGLAPENLRFAEPGDETIGQLADTLLAAGVLIPPIVRPGRKGEQRFMALDGRRRRLALLALKDRGAIDDDYAFDCLLAESQGQQTAAILLPNIEHAPSHIADVIVAIGRLRKAKMETPAIARALGYGELEIRRLEALSAVEPTVLRALRAGRLTLKQARLIARLAHPAQQVEFAQTALDGYLQGYQLRAALDGGRITLEDPRFTLVGLDRYVAAGGRVVSDLFGELPDTLLDGEVLQAAWRERVQPIADGLAQKSLTVFFGREVGYVAPEGFARLDYVYERDLPAARRAALQEARRQVQAAVAALGAFDAEAEDTPRRLLDLAVAMAREASAPLAEGCLGAVLITPESGGHGVEVTFFAKMPAEDQADEGDDPDEDTDGDEGNIAPRGGSRLQGEAPDIVTPQRRLDVSGVSHGLQEARTGVATRGLIRDLADQPEAALIVLLAQLFKELGLRSTGGRDAAALQLVATRYSHAVKVAIPSLDGVVRTRLEARRAAYLASGLRPIPWVASLSPDERLALLAELTAIGLNLCEARTDQLRPAARAEAEEIVALCGADLGSRWTPDIGFLTVHAKPQLLAMLTEMGADDSQAKTLRKDALAVFVAEAARARRSVDAVGAGLALRGR